MSRLEYQRRMIVGTVLNVGSGENPGSVPGVQLDKMDYGLPGQVIGDACALEFPDDSFDTVVLGDVIEHVEDPGQALREAVRVARKRVILTVPKDERLPPGQHVEEARRLDADRMHPTINFFSEDWLRSLVDPLKVRVLDWQFVPEENWMNWLITLEVL